MSKPAPSPAACVCGHPRVRGVHRCALPSCNCLSYAAAQRTTPRVPPEAKAVLVAALASHGHRLQFPTEATMWHAVEAWIVAGRPGLPSEKP